MAVDQKTVDVDQKIKEIKTKYIPLNGKKNTHNKKYRKDLNTAITEFIISYRLSHFLIYRLYNICEKLTDFEKFRNIAKEIDNHHGRTKSLLSCTILKKEWVSEWYFPPVCFRLNCVRPVKPR